MRVQESGSSPLRAGNDLKMNAADADYSIRVERAPGAVRAYHDETLFAQSDAALILHETRLPSAVYFPLRDLEEGLLEASSFKTFCPFKGSATHWHVAIGDERIENAAWSYPNPLEDAAPLRDHVAFYPKVVSSLVAEPEIDLHPVYPHTSGPLIDWLLRGAWNCRSAGELTAELARRLLTHGVQVCRVNVGLWSLHPQLVGRVYTWQRESDAVTLMEAPHGALDSPDYLDSPVRHVAEGLGGVRQRLDVPDPEFTFPILDQLRAAGCSDYVAMPLPYSRGRTQSLSLASDRPGGFSTAELGATYECVAALGRFYEVLSLREDMSVLLDTYLGRHPGQQVLRGQTRRGAGTEIHAAILFCDLRDSTELAQRLDRDAYLALLNEFFACAVEPVLARGGEVLKFIGDAILAFFPIESEEPAAERRACERARDATLDTLARLEATRSDTGAALRSATGLHLGPVSYGNVGSDTRLDFTVIGTATNIASRLSDCCKEFDHPVLLSGECARHLGAATCALGSKRLRGIAGEVEVFGLVA